MSSSPLTECFMCFEHHSYDTGCLCAHGKEVCRDCWTIWVQHQLSLSPSKGPSCIFCRGVIYNDVVEALIGCQTEFRNARREAEREQEDRDLDRLQEHIHRMDEGFMEIVQLDYPTQRPWRGGQRSCGAARAFETHIERARRRARRERRLAEMDERVEMSRRETLEWQHSAARLAEQESVPVNHDIIGPYDNYSSDEDDWE